MESHIDKIKKCLQLAGNNSSAHEVENALKMAQRLALKAGINIEDIELDSAKRKAEIEQDGIDQTTKTCPSWRYYICKIIADNFRTSVYIAKGHRESSLKVIGLPEDVQITKEVFAYAENAYLRLSKQYIDEVKKTRSLDRSLSIRLKNDYFHGFKKGLEEAFAENVKELGLIVLKPEEVGEWISDNCRTNRVAGVKRLGNQEAIGRGMNDGSFVGKSKRHEYLN